MHIQHEAHPKKAAVQHGDGPGPAEHGDGRGTDVRGHVAEGPIPPGRRVGLRKDKIARAGGRRGVLLALIRWFLVRVGVRVGFGLGAPCSFGGLVGVGGGIVEGYELFCFCVGWN